MQIRHSSTNIRGHRAYAVKITFYRQHGRFPAKSESLLAPSLDYLADQVGVTSSQWVKPKARTEQRRKEDVLSYLGIQPY